MSNRTKPLFPDIELDIARSRLAEAREARQRARELLKTKQGYITFILNSLTKDGPTTDANLMFALVELRDQGAWKEAFPIFDVCHALWLTSKLWRQKVDHPSGEPCHLYGIRGTHPKQ